MARSLLVLESAPTIGLLSADPLWQAHCRL